MYENHCFSIYMELFCFCSGIKIVFGFKNKMRVLFSYFQDFMSAGFDTAAYEPSMRFWILPISASVLPNATALLTVTGLIPNARATSLHVYPNLRTAR